MNTSRSVALIRLLSIASLHAVISYGHLSHSNGVPSCIDHVQQGKHSALKLLLGGDSNGLVSKNDCTIVVNVAALGEGIQGEKARGTVYAHNASPSGTNTHGTSTLCLHISCMANTKILPGSGETNDSGDMPLRSAAVHSDQHRLLDESLPSTVPRTAPVRVDPDLASSKSR